MAATETSARANAVLDELYREHVGDVYRYTYAVLGNHADAEDVTQTTFVNALRALERGETPEDPSRWLTVIAHNLVRQRWRQAAARPALVELETDVADAEEDEEAFELEELVRALQRIPETQREAIVMRELEGRSYREIAIVMGLSTSALETLLFRARRSLAEELENVVTCQNAELALSKRLDGRLSRKERRRLEEHLADCPDCARLAATQQRQRRAFKGLALLPLPIGLALFKGAPSAAAATSVPTIGLGTAAPGAGGSGAAAGGAGGTTASGGAAAGGSLAGSVVVKIAAVVVTATVATGVGYKGVQAVRDTPSAPPPAHGKTEARDVTNVPSAPARVSATGSKNAQKAHAQGKQHAASHGRTVTSAGPTKHERSATSGLTQETPAASSGQAASPGTDHATVPSHTPGQVRPKHVESPKPAGAKQASGEEDASQPEAPGGNPNAGPKQQAPSRTAPDNTPPQNPLPVDPTAPATPQTTPPASDGTAGSATAPTSGAPVQGAPQTSSPPPSQPPTTSPPATNTPPPPSTPPSSPPPDTTGTPPDSSDAPGNNGWDNGKKLGHYNENQDGKHLVSP